MLAGGCADGAGQDRSGPIARRTIPDIMEALEARAAKSLPIKGTGRCLLQYYVEGKQKKEEFPVKFWVRPQHEVYLQGDVAFDPRGLVVGANAEEFWVSLRPKEISSYWWGRWDDVGGGVPLMISPRVVLEALGVMGPAEEGVWEIGWDKDLEVLTRRGQDNIVQKRVYIAGQTEVRRIEYYDEFGAPTVTATLEKYQDVVTGFAVPRLLTMVRRGVAGKDDTVRLTINSAAAADISQKQADYLFVRPQPKGFDHVFTSVRGRWVEQE